MAVKLRLRRMGRKKRPVYAVVAADTRSPRDGRYIEDLGRYAPINEPAEMSLKEDRILYWLQQGAQPSDTVRNLLSKQGIMLRLHLLRKGKTEDEIEQEVEAFRARRAEKGQTVKITASDRARQALEAERKQAEAERKRIEEERKAREAELERQRQEAEAQRRAEAEAQRAEAEAASAEAEAAEGETVEASAEEVPEGAPAAAKEQPVVEASEGEDIATAEAEAASTEEMQAESEEANEAAESDAAASDESDEEKA